MPGEKIKFIDVHKYFIGKQLDKIADLDEETTSTEISVTFDEDQPVFKKAKLNQKQNEPFLVTPHHPIDPPVILMGEPIFLNPNSYLTIEKVLDELCQVAFVG